MSSNTVVSALPRRVRRAIRWERPVDTVTGGEGAFVGRWSAHARKYLGAFAALTTAVGALPLFFDPVGWARVVGWHIPQNTDLVVYLGRGGACFILIFEALMLRAALTGAQLRHAYDILLAVLSSMVVLHVWGALLKAQPPMETIEIGLYSGTLALALLFYPDHPA